MKYAQYRELVLSSWKCIVPEQERGDLKIRKFSVSAEEAMRFNLNCNGRPIKAGEYTKLTSNKEFWMSDAPAEMDDHAELFAVVASPRAAVGDVLVFGLGIGCSLNVMLEIIKAKGLSRRVTVIEINPDIIAMVQPSFQQWIDEGLLEIIEGDALQFKPKKGQRWGAVWCDIWPTISDENLKDMRMFRRRFARRADWIGCWAERECREFHKVIVSLMEEILVTKGYESAT